MYDFQIEFERSSNQNSFCLWQHATLPDDVFGSYDEPSGNESEAVNVSKNESSEEEEKTVKYRLIRFFDLTYKKPGEKYFYRVRLWFKDPNNPANFTSSNTGPGGDGNFFDGSDAPDDEGRGSDSRSKTVPKAPLLLDDLSPIVRPRLLQPVRDVAGLPDEIDGVPTKDVLSTIVLVSSRNICQRLEPGSEKSGVGREIRRRQKR
jgi:hypothetical protein